MNKRYTTLLIDDEKLAIQRLQRLLTKYTHFIEVIGEAYNGQEGLDKIEHLKPELIFLDIEMPLMNGFEMLSKIKHQPIVVFATAFEDYAIRAFEENSIDYLLKPIEQERLEKTIAKLQNTNSLTNQDYNQQIYEILEKFKPKKEISSLAVKIGERILLVRLDEIAYFEAEDKYVFAHTMEGKKHLIDYSLTALEEKLPAEFLRVSRSHIINSQTVQEIQKYFNGKFALLLNDLKKTKIISGTSYAQKVKGMIEI